MAAMRWLLCGTAVVSTALCSIAVHTVVQWLLWDLLYGGYCHVTAVWRQLLSVSVRWLLRGGGCAVPPLLSDQCGLQGHLYWGSVNTLMNV